MFSSVSRFVSLPSLFYLPTPEIMSHRLNTYGVVFKLLHTVQTVEWSLALQEAFFVSLSNSTPSNKRTVTWMRRDGVNIDMHYYRPANVKVTSGETGT